jgi:hypothetical protein
MTPVPVLTRRVAAEAVGAGTLVAAVVGSGIMATRLTGDVLLQLLVNATATVAVLALLIAVLGPVSGAHFNPAVTLVEAARGDLPPYEAGAYVAAQLVGGLAGTGVANLMFELPAYQASRHPRSGAGVRLGEVVATAGLLFVIAALTRTGRGRLGPPAGPGLDRRRVLLHLLHLLCQPRRHPCPGLVRHLRRYRPRLGASIHRHPSRRSRPGRRPRGGAVPSRRACPARPPGAPP